MQNEARASLPPAPPLDRDIELLNALHRVVRENQLWAFDELAERKSEGDGDTYEAGYAAGVLDLAAQLQRAARKVRRNRG